MAFSPQSTRTLDKLTPIAPQQTLLQQQLQQSITTVLPPSTAQPNNINNNSALDNCKLSTTFNCNNGCAWRMCMFPHGYKTEQHFSLFLYAFQTDYEKNHGIQLRTIKYVFELFKVQTNPATFKAELKPIDISQSIFKKSFNLDQKGDSGGKAKFCELTSLFPNNDTTIEVDVMIRTKLYLEDNLQSSNNDIISNFFNSIGSNANKFQPSLESYFNNNNFSDVTFSFSDESEIKASRLALSMRSNYFNKMFNGEWAESKANTIRIDDVTYQCFKSLIYFLYTGVLSDDLPFNVLKDLCVEADNKDIPELGRLVVSRITDHASSYDWADILLLGWKIKNLSLKNLALQYIHDNWEIIKRERMIYDLMSRADAEQDQPKIDNKRVKHVHRIESNVPGEYEHIITSDRLLAKFKVSGCCLSAYSIEVDDKDDIEAEISPFEEARFETGGNGRPLNNVDTPKLDIVNFTKAF
ncbi:20970_t:CDS:2 [Entrophospora sp. SA101]|nr:20970_t:CDS:2 [Entrophospora sp. SA101]CAJ0825320.1 3707_t:CDS:2 [Entrophospora sp. SA101]CAJ0913501.1 8693_t:CDS:2 [Entrophospora sp. SA101]